MPEKCLRIEEMTENDREIFQDFISIKCQREGFFEFTWHELNIKFTYDFG